MPPIRRTLKNVVKNFSDAQIKVREATSNDPWGPSSTLMSEIADLTYNVVAFTEIMQMLWKRLNDHGKNWRHVYKSLVLLDYIIKTGSEKVAQQCKENIFAIQTLKDFQHIEENKDQGMNVREKAKQLVSLLKDDERLKNERAKALKAKERFAQSSIGVGSQGQGGGFGAGSPTLQSGSGGYQDPYGGATGQDDTSPSGRRLSTDLESARPSSVGEEELQLQLALAMSKEEHEEELKKQKSDDIKLQLAIEESQKDDDKTLIQLLLVLAGILAGQETVSPGPPVTTSSLVDVFDSGTRGQPLQTDPWGAPLQRVPPTSHPPDPWGAPSAKPASNMGPQTPGTRLWLPLRLLLSSQTDPWGAPAPQATPWTTSAGNAASPGGFDSFGHSTTTTTNGTSGNIDDAFDLLSSRTDTVSPSQGKTNNAAMDGFDPLTGSTSNNGVDPWNMSSVDQALGANARKKSPQEFLGANAGLVNLDDLVSRAPQKGTNPFTASASNPFEQSNQRVPLNQLQNTNASGFAQPGGATLLPTPLIPVNTSSQPMQPQASYNPFL
ncbi:LOW QUALITY PROTEIN: epsin-2-like [Liolophura sinensis]|uniref:LOW QUALITY PROTEIN: epsin-2-like n=1 Tax=Liolophura sinensis TaxID=3198878 RepID=UPI003158C9E3